MNTVSSLVYAVAMAVAMSSGTALAAMPPVGEVTLSIGMATLHTHEGGERRVVRGASIRPGDLIQTEGGGHVHIRFADGALVSVRPFSRLVVEEYLYSATQAERSQVRFRLERGSARAISGAAAENARERFRLNTPLVAIGVRGTDFTVLTSEQVTTAAVSQGAIVMAPLGEDCSASSFGPCETQTSRLLSADMEGLLAEFRSGLSQPELRAQLLDNAFPDAGKTPDASRSSVSVTGDDAADTRWAGSLRQELAAQKTEMAIASSPDERPVSLVWGRWGDSISSSDISVPRDEARTKGEPVVYGWPYTLYRHQSDVMEWPKALGRMAFNLQAASAQWQTFNGTSAAVVTGGQLTIDFANSRYSTQLKLDGVPYLLSTINASGRIGRDGVFSSRASGQSVAGAVGLDGLSAGYLFQKASQAGIVSGITLWSR